MILKLIKRLMPENSKNLLRRVYDFINWDPWVKYSWSQEGEDMVLQRIFAQNKKGFYVDVGAHHPMRFSNTYMFYRRGWSGINIDAMPGSMRLFEKWRRRDINIEIGIGQKSEKLDYYIFNEPALNGFSVKLSEERNLEENNYFVKEILKIDVKPLSEILDQHLQNSTIEFLSVDVEGLDLAVLKSNDWSRYRPKFVLVEILKSSLHNLDQDPVFLFMKEQGYAVYAKQVNTVFFEDLNTNNLY